MAFGLNDTGFEKKKITDVLDSVEERQIEAFGIVDNDADSVLGQLNGVFAEAVGSVWDLAEDVYLSQAPSTAEGTPLDAVVDINNLSRKPATSSTVTAILEGDEGTVVPIGTQFKQFETNQIFQNLEAVTITKANLLKTIISIDSVGAGAYTVTLAGIAYTYNAGGGDSASDILNGLKNAIDDTIYLPELIPATGTATQLQITALQVVNPILSFDMVTTGNIAIDEIWTPKTISSVNTGAISVPLGSIVSIETPVSGLNDIDNLTEGERGSNIETDTALRLRRKSSLAVIGGASVPAIRSRVESEVEDVSFVLVEENTTDYISSRGLPPHSIRVVVEGGADQDIAKKIWEVKAGGIETAGEIDIIVTDSEGEEHSVKFSRLGIRWIHINAEITLNSEEVFPTDGIDQIRQSLADFGNALNAGNDLIIQRFYTAIYAIPGVRSVELFEFAVTTNAGDTPGSLNNGSTTGTAVNQCIDNVAGFITNNIIRSGMVIYNETTNDFTTIKAIIDDDTLNLSDDIFQDPAFNEQWGAGYFGAIDIPIGPAEKGSFDISRITVTVV